MEIQSLRNYKMRFSDESFMCVMPRDEKTKKILSLVLGLQKDDMGCFETRGSEKNGIIFKFMHYM